MKNLRLHLGWAVVTVIAAAGWGRIVAGRPDPGPPAPNSAPAPSFAPPAPAAPPAIGRSPAPAVPETAPGAPSEVQEIRRLLLHRNTWWEGFQRLRELADLELKTELLTELVRNGASPARASAIHELVRLKGRAVSGLLLEILQNEKDPLRTLAAQGLGKAGAVEATGKLLETVRAEDSPLRLESAAALLKLGVPGPGLEVLDACARRYESPDGGVRRQAIEDVAHIEHPAAFPLLARALRDSNGDVRLSAIWAVAETFPTQAMPLIEALTADPNREVAEAAREALEDIRQQK